MKNQRTILNPTKYTTKVLNQITLNINKNKQIICNHKIKKLKIKKSLISNAYIEDRTSNMKVRMKPNYGKQNHRLSRNRETDLPSFSGSLV